MDYNVFLNRVIDDGIKAVKTDYVGADGHMVQKREGSLVGFNECRGKTPELLLALLQEANSKMQLAFAEDGKDYWYLRCRAAEIEWVCNVVAAKEMMEGKPSSIVVPTANGVLKAKEIIFSEPGQSGSCRNPC